MSGKAYLSGLGMMGRRHLLGLLRAGFDVVASDTRASSVDAAKAAIEAAKLPLDRFRVADPSGKFDVAVFSETATSRFENVSAFLKNNFAKRYLLEKPLTSDQATLDRFSAAFKNTDSEVCVNFPRRTWAISPRLKELCGASTFSQYTVTGGAAGFGCNGIHYLDFWLYLLGMPKDVKVLSSTLSDVSVASGRGAEFQDLGGSFLVTCSKGSFFCSLGAESSAPPTVSLRGDHFICWVDEADLNFKLKARRKDSVKPNYLYGHDYETVDQGTLALMPLDQVTEGWAAGRIALPTLSTGLDAHRLLFGILEASGASKPYRFT